MMEISKQQIIDCSWGSGNHGCRGGFPAKALAWVARNGVATKKSYGPYLGEVSNKLSINMLNFNQSFIYI
jgi:hypothetical protein